MNIKKIIILFLFLSFIGFRGFSQAANTADSLILINIYNDTNGENWFEVWDLNSPVSSWNGVSLNSEGRVECLALVRNADCMINEQEFNLNLTGTFPDISGLNELKNFKVKDNVFDGFPLFISSLTKLENIYLASSFIEGALQSNLTNLSNLKALNLSVNRLSGGMPAFLGALEKLEILNLSFNNFNGQFPLSFLNLKNLKHLRLRGMDLTGTIPENIDELSKIQTLILCDNKFEGELPSSMGNLDNLTDLDLSRNLLTGRIPEGMMSTLSNSMSLNSNDLEGCFPEDFFEFGCNVYMNLSNNPKMANYGGNISFCTPVNQIGLPCNDGYLSTENDAITEDCECEGTYTPYEVFCGAKEELHFTTIESGGCELAVEGLVIFNRKEDNNYEVRINLGGQESSDVTFGIYTQCYGAWTDQVFLKVEKGALQFVGVGPVQETFNLVNHYTNGNSLILEVESEYTNYTVDIKNEKGWKSLFCFIDEDGDGFEGDIDCNDLDSEINPDALDLTTNGIDEDCDGVDGPTSAKNIEENIAVYPNPVSNFLKLDNINTSKYLIQIFDVQGNLRFEKQNVNQLNIDVLSLGIYVLNVIDLDTQDSIFTTRLVKVQ